MDDAQFAELLASIKDMGKHMRGEKVPGVRIRELSSPEIKNHGCTASQREIKDAQGNV